MKKKQRTDTKKDAKRFKSNNFTWSNREKSNIAIKDKRDREQKRERTV